MKRAMPRTRDSRTGDDAARRDARVRMLRDLAPATDAHADARREPAKADRPARRRGAFGTFGRFTYYAALVLVVAGIGFAGGGFLRFVDRVETLTEAAPADRQRADAIVVLTGGPNRLREAGSLLEARRAGHLLVSGVNLRTTEPQVRRLLDVDDDLFTCCVDLGFEARDTRGNAREGAGWFARLVSENAAPLDANGALGANGEGRVIVVTSNYHMQRSLYEFSRLLPNVELIPHAVTGLDVENGKWWREAGNWRLLGGEFAKLWLARMRDYPQMNTLVNRALAVLRPVPTAEAAN